LVGTLVFRQSCTLPLRKAIIMKYLLCCVSVAAVVCGASRICAQSRNLELTMQDGRVTIIAHNVPLRDILAEWSRVGQTRIVNADKLEGPPLTLQLVNQTERDALDILLRSAAGYIAASRPADRPGKSNFDRITILASSRAPAATAVATAAAAPQPVASAPVPVYNADDDAPMIVAQPSAPHNVQQSAQQGSQLGGMQSAPRQPYAAVMPQGRAMNAQLEITQPKDILKGMAQSQAQPAASPLSLPRPGGVQIP
jgi:hypothetical protein